MKFMHLGDLHIGKTLGDFDLYEDQEYILKQLLTIIDEKEVKGVLIAGDVWDRAMPSEAATTLLDWFLTSLANKNVKVFMISGNHDSDDRLSYAKRFFEARNVYVSAIYQGSLEKVTVTEDGEEIDVYMLPFVKASQVRHYFPDEKIDSYDAAVRMILSNASIDRAKCNLLVAHQFVAGKGEDPTLGGSESIGTQSVGLVEKIGYDCFDDFDYVALGHIHSPQRVGRDEVRYSGSPLKYSISEAKDAKSVPIINVCGKGNVQVELVPLKPLRDLRHITGTMEELLKMVSERSDDYIHATITDEEVVTDAMGILQKKYPRTVKIDYENAHTKELEQIDISNVTQNKSFSELISDFYHQMYGCEISDEEMEVMRAVAREAGVFNEAD